MASEDASPKAAPLQMSPTAQKQSLASLDDESTDNGNDKRVKESVAQKNKYSELSSTLQKILLRFSCAILDDFFRNLPQIAQARKDTLEDVEFQRLLRLRTYEKVVDTGMTLLSIINKSFGQSQDAIQVLECEKKALDDAILTLKLESALNESLRTQIQEFVSRTSAAEPEDNETEAKYIKDAISVVNSMYPGMFAAMFTADMKPMEENAVDMCEHVERAIDQKVAKFTRQLDDIDKQLKSQESLQKDKDVTQDRSEELVSTLGQVSTTQDV